MSVLSFLSGPAMTSLLAILSFAAGLGLAVQAGANARLARALGTPHAATALQLAVGMLALAVLAAGAGELGALARLPHVVPWHAAGGAASAIYVLAVILVAPRLGAVVAIGLLIAGQTFASLLLDGLGLLGLVPRGFPIPVLAGSALALVGVAAIVRAQQGEVSAIRTRPALVLLALAAGALLPVQGAVNGLLRAELGAPLATGLVSFAVATASMLAFLVPARLLARLPPVDVRGLKAMPAWGWLGGIMGAFYVTTVFTGIPAIGAASVVALTVAGQQTAALVVDRFGLLGFPVRAISASRIAGVALLLAGVVTIRFSA